MELRKATRQKAKLRIGLSAASGFGKTYSALLAAKGIAGTWDKVAVIDTENGSAELYSDLGEYNALPLEAPYSSERYIEAIRACENAGMEVIIIDSISHEWEGVGGCLEIHEKLGGRFDNWKDVTPRHRAFIDAILQSKCHVITTVRRKQDYSLVEGTNKQGRTVATPQKVGMKEVTREGFEYELTLNLEIINDKHLAKASKDRTGLFMDKPEFIITEETGKQLKEWAETGISAVDLAISELNSCTDRECSGRVYHKYPQYHSDSKFLEAVKAMSEKYPKPVQQTTNTDTIIDNGNEILKVNPDTAEAAPVKYASARQKEKILNLLNNPVITRQEKTKQLLNINKLSEEIAEQVIKKLQEVIDAREAETGAA